MSWLFQGWKRLLFSALDGRGAAAKNMAAGSFQHDHKLQQEFRLRWRSSGVSKRVQEEVVTTPEQSSLNTGSRWVWGHAQWGEDFATTCGNENSKKLLLFEKNKKDKLEFCRKYKDGAVGSDVLWTVWDMWILVCLEKKWWGLKQLQFSPIESICEVSLPEQHHEDRVGAKHLKLVNIRSFYSELWDWRGSGLNAL